MLPTASVPIYNTEFLLKRPEGLPESLLSELSNYVRKIKYRQW